MRISTITSLGTAPLASASLEPWAFEPLPLGALRLEGDGLAGHLHEFYDYVAHEPWLGGFPYWYNGLVPLAYHLDDDRLKEQVHSATQYVIDHQQEDGWLGVETGTQRNFWARHMLCLGMIQLAEANSTWEEPIVDSLHKFSKLMNSMLANNYTGYLYHEGDEFDEGEVQWGRWLYEKHPSNQKNILLENMRYLHDAALKWESFYNDQAYFGQGFDKALGTLPDNLTEENFPFEHGVNVGQGFKAAGVTYRFTRNESLITTAKNGVGWTMFYHGSASGTVLADERLQGLMPFSGSELCTVVETMYSLAYLYQSLGDADYAERAELAAFNALPAMLTPDWWARQYVAQPNQPFGTRLNDDSVYWNVNAISQTFGLEINYPCCTVNHGQGYPKFTSSLYARVGDNGLAHIMLSPSSLRTHLKGDNTVHIACDTGYPFLDQLSYTINSTSAFDFYVRVPGWANTTSSIQVDDGPPAALSPNSKSGLHKLSIPRGHHNITYTLDSSIKAQPRANNTIAVYKGALLYAIEVTYNTTSGLAKPYNQPNGPEFPSKYPPAKARDYELHNTSAWNVAIDPSTLKYVAPTIKNASELANPIFAPGAPPASISAKGCLIDWPLYKNSTPGYAPLTEGRKCLGGIRDVRLIPYGASKLHMAEIPIISLGNTGS
ncbi:hypothetical protein K431DRAFT_336291 [Polychaeton citri CBS 116435]|uniref:Non-reducing end beta-L-arabinofuranosidase-like GH127 catalytic domain-containing protein n=1 Tax=Polychaeton citri CBS 116435 TaxID=1314669 RepID=A0A9P4QDK4_9PEZI|nr:hypothetical protein K431DRAFT_336291 [Polychaeton citri CBS 116435]